MVSQLPTTSPDFHHNLDLGSDADTASQRSISLSSPSHSPRHSLATHESDDAHMFLANPSAFLRGNDKRESNQFTVDTDFSSEPDDMSMYNKRRMSIAGETPDTSAAPSILEDERPIAVRENITMSSILKSPDARPSPMQATIPSVATTYPPFSATRDDTVSISSFMSTTSSRKVRPETLLLAPSNEPLVLGIALVDFNHLVCSQYPTSTVLESHPTHIGRTSNRMVERRDFQ